jgi:hypothetical protein
MLKWKKYEAFLEDIEADLSKTAKKKITPYMLKVLTGVFTIAAGYKLTYVANCTNKIIVGTVENAIKKKNIISKYLLGENNHLLYPKAIL